MGTHGLRDAQHLVGATFGGRYRLDELVAVGGFGAVFRATHLPTGCDVAIKVVHDDLAEDAAILERFRREAATVQSLRAPNTVATYELGETEEGRLFMAMEWLRGESLVDRLAREGRLPWRQAVAIVRAVCEALAEAHGMGIVHRDLKPANIHLEPWSDDGFVKVLDFGIAKAFRPEAHVGMCNVMCNEELTQVGEVVGTLEYMAPEQIVGSAVDGRTDLYALGVVLYELVTGMRPFADATDATALIGAMLSQRPRRPSRMRTRGPVPAAFDAIVLRCLAPRRRDRFADVEALAAALDELERAAELDAPAQRISAWSMAPATVVAAPMAMPAMDDELLDVTVVAQRPRSTALQLDGLARVTDVVTVPPMPVVDVTPSGRAARGSIVAIPALDRAMVVGWAPRSVPAPLAAAPLPSPSITPPPSTATERTVVARTSWRVVTIAAIAATLAAFGGALAML